MRQTEVPSAAVARRSEAGFTLIELLVAMAMLALMSVLGWRGLDGIVRGRQTLNLDLARTRDMQLSFAQMQSDCRRLAPGTLLGKRPALLVQPGRLMLARTVSDELSPTRLQIVVYRLRGGELSRWESYKTRDLREFDLLWASLAASLDSTQAGQPVLLQSRLEAMRLRLWDNSIRAWHAVAAGETAAFVQPDAARPRWNGLEVELLVHTTQSDTPARMIKTFLLEGP